MTQDILCLHHNDQDGICAGAIVRHKFGDDVILHQIDYGLPVPWDKIEAAQTVILTDFSLPFAEMTRIQASKGKKFIWIDHHISAMKEMDALPLEGIRTIEKSGCVLTWEYFFPDIALPAGVKFIGDRDIWKFEYPETHAYCEGLFSMEIDIHNDEFWQQLFADDTALTQKIMTHGEILLDARLKSIHHRVKHYGFETTFEGYKTMAINMPSSGDVGHHINDLGYDVAYVYSEIMLDGQYVTKVTLYTQTVDVSVLAKAHGGGGHKGAAGFQFIRKGNRPFPPDLTI